MTEFVQLAGLTAFVVTVTAVLLAGVMHLAVRNDR